MEAKETCYGSKRDAQAPEVHEQGTVAMHAKDVGAEDGALQAVPVVLPHALER